jgi:hypothetical protein
MNVLKRCIYDRQAIHHSAIVLSDLGNIAGFGAKLRVSRAR